jgi:hypothetical protein
MSLTTPMLCSEVAGGVTQTIVCLFREPDAGNPPVRFDEREQEPESSQTGLRRRSESQVNSHRETNATAPVLDSTRDSAHPMREDVKQKHFSTPSVRPDWCLRPGLFYFVEKILVLTPGASQSTTGTGIAVAVLP